MSSRGKMVGVFLLGFAVLFFSSSVEAQYTTGTIQGTVLDTSGAAVNQAQVTLRSKETNSLRTFTTGADGIYIFAAVPPGTYDLTAEAPNFAKASAIITATSNGNVSQNLTLPLSSQATSVTVEALAAAEFNTTDAQEATTRSELEVSTLPVQGRDLTTTFALEPGVQPMYTAGRGSLVKVAGAQTGLIAANGGRPESSNVEIDFTDANDWEFGGIAVGAAPVPDLVQELKVITSNPSAEYGVKSNGEIQFVTKSGTNYWHGDAYDFLKNDWLNARDYFGKSGKATRIDSNNYGFSTGGAVIKDKTFLLGGWQQLKQLGGGFTTQALVPTQAARDNATDPVGEAYGEGEPRSGRRDRSGRSRNGRLARGHPGNGCRGSAQLSGDFRKVRERNGLRRRNCHAPKQTALTARLACARLGLRAFGGRCPNVARPAEFVNRARRAVS